MPKNSTPTAIKFSDTAKNNTFEDCKIYGKVQMADKNNKMRRTLIDVKKNVKEHPIKTIIIGLIIIVFGLLIEYSFFK